MRIHLKTFCASSLNNTTIEKTLKSRCTVSVNSPVIFGIVCDVTTGLLAPAVFDSDARSPAADLRGARSLNGVRDMPNIFRWVLFLACFTSIKVKVVHSK